MANQHAYMANQHTYMADQHTYMANQHTYMANQHRHNPNKHIICRNILFQIPNNTERHQHPHIWCVVSYFPLLNDLRDFLMSLRVDLSAGSSAQHVRIRVSIPGWVPSGLFSGSWGLNRLPPFLILSMISAVTVNGCFSCFPNWYMYNAEPIFKQIRVVFPATVMFTCRRTRLSLGNITHQSRRVHELSLCPLEYYLLL